MAEQYPLSKSSIIEYSDFKESNWYIYWDTGYSKIRKYQLLVVWHISHDQEVYYDYMHLHKLVEKNNALAGIPYRDKLPDDDKELFKRICSEFVYDVELEYPEE